MLPLPSLYFLGRKLIVAEISTKPPLSIYCTFQFKIVAEEPQQTLCLAGYANDCIFVYPGNKVF
jgi:hypothetical protein